MSKRKKNISCIPGVSIGDFEMEVADLTSSDIWVGKFKSLNDQLEGIARQRAQLASEHKCTDMGKLPSEDELILKMILIKKKNFE